MLKLARWSTTHRLYVVIGWIVLLFAVNAFAQSAGTSYSNNFTLPNSDAQRAADLLTKSFPAQAGDRDTIVYKVNSGTVQDPAVKARMSAMFAEVAKLPHVAAVISPYAGAAAGKSMSLAEASACKLYAAQATMEVCLEAVQLFGGNGYMAEYQVEQLCRDAKVLQIYGGTDEIQVSQIARSLLGS